MNRFSDRDLLMRYHWGLGVGHLHAHQHAATSIPGEDSHIRTQSPDCEPDVDENDVGAQTQDRDGDNDADDPELSLTERDLEGWEDVASDDSDNELQVESHEDDFTDEEDFTGM
jgi:hypothetical protein